MSTCTHALSAAPGTLNASAGATKIDDLRRPRKQRAYRHKNYRTREFLDRFIASDRTPPQAPAYWGRVKDYLARERMFRAEKLGGSEQTCTANGTRAR